jgi:large-conductance mechanosensitive channel
MSGIFTAYMLNSCKQNIIDPVSESFFSQTNFGLDLDPNKPVNKTVKWKNFLKDFIIWVIIMILLYLLWKHIIKPVKGNGIGVQQTFVPTKMNIGKNNNLILSLANLTEKLNAITDNEVSENYHPEHIFDLKISNKDLCLS